VSAAGLRLPTWRAWAGKGSWAIMDQGLFALSNFAVNILLARWLAPAEYGAYAIGYASFLLLGTLHTALFTEPMLVFGPRKHRERLGTYLRVLLRGHWAFGAAMSALFGIAALALTHHGDSPLAPTALGVAIAAPFILFQWLMRKACYVNLQPRLAASAGALYMVLILSGMYGVSRLGWLNPASALAVMAGGSLWSGLWLLYRLASPPQKTEIEREVFEDHLRYGRWASGAAALSWVPANALLLLLPVLWGLEASAAFRALANLLLPFGNVITALGAILLPVFVRNKAAPGFRRLVLHLSAAFVAAAIVYWLLLGVFHEQLFSLLYGGKYADYAGLLWLAGLIPLVSALNATAGGALRALERPNKVFRAECYGAALTVGLGTLLVMLWGVLGAVVSLLVANSVAARAMHSMFAAEVTRVRDVELTRN
jgi:O-antigen/teichoic acid export membrane protein